MDKYRLICPKCGKTYGKYDMLCPLDGSFLRTEYSKRQFEPCDLPGIWKFYNWLPVEGIIKKGSSKTITYKSEGFADKLGLENLFISFNGYWPEKEAYMRTCSFKDLEAYPTMQRVTEQKKERILVVASAGNTARAFAHVSSITGLPLLLVVPENAIEKLWIPAGSTSSICVAAVKGDYYAAISIAAQITDREKFMPEGGAKNVGRRDGMGTVMLDATLTMKRLPDHYFQAVGSGTGGIAAWEAAMRLKMDGRYGDELPQLHLAQNLPCAPLIHLHKGVPVDPKCPEGMYDPVLFNRKPPYAVGGGVRDALETTEGDLYGITNKEAEEARLLFEELEGIDIMNSAAVATAALIKAVRDTKVSKSDLIMLNITGGGVKKALKELATIRLEPDLVVSPEDSDAPAKIIQRTEDKFE
ncbi:cysteate synthase [Methanohalophilus sp. RSK]|uniref:cysteate synthase n=1 Tax=Methanohalophilus sp. RSK TaxID=2485783 RepID=UPI000F43DC3D|nr:cysteate synthase [Methanohalophilus sp. RSK]RNI13980.1 cysteate synthase [Methanohalophilus sp. RSK]